jgi:hypothetical protein
MDENMHDEFIWAVEEAVTQNLSLYDDVCQHAAESDGDLAWLYNHVSWTLQMHRTQNPEAWDHLPADQPIPGDAIWEAVESGVDWVRKYNSGHPIVKVWEART